MNTDNETCYNLNHHKKDKVNIRKGKVFIASMRMRGKWAQEVKKSRKLNVTSMQRNNSPDKIAFSPMTSIVNMQSHKEGCNVNPITEFYCFENMWQSGKVFEGIGS